MIQRTTLGALLLAACTRLPLPIAAAAPPRPNFLFILSDDHAAHAVSAYGSRINSTPQIDRLARGGMLFRNCFAVNSICTPSRASILTGKYSHKNGVTVFNRFDGSQETLPKLLQRAGYVTSLVGKWHLFSDPTGFDYWNVLPGQGLYHDPVFIENGEEKKLQGYTTDIITEVALARLRARPADRPFALFVHHKAPHRNWEPDEKHAKLYDDQTILEPATFGDTHEGRSRAAREATMTIERDLRPTDLKADPPPGLSAEARKSWCYQRYIKDYLRCVAAVDDGIGRLLDELRTAGLEEDTVVVYTSDQGFFLGDHGWYDKRFMYEESIRMPLLVRYPRLVRPGSEEAHMVLNVDFAPTLLELAGVALPADLQGRSFVPLLEGKAPSDWRTSMYYRYYHYPQDHAVQPHYGVRTERHKLIHFNKLDEWELYDLEKDPGEMHNLYGDPAHAAVTFTLKTELQRLREQLDDHDQFAAGPPKVTIAPRDVPVKLEARLQARPGKPFDLAAGRGFNPAQRTFTAGVGCLPRGPDGVIAALGGESHGFALHLEGWEPRFSLRLEGDLITLRAGSHLQPGAWSHVVGQIGADGDARLYVNGTLAASAESGAIASKPHDGLSIGEDTGSKVGEYSSSGVWKGRIDDLRLYSGVLSASEIAAWAAPRAVKLEVEVEEEVARCEPAGNGAGPLWCYGAPLVARRGDEVFASALETGAGVPPLSNTRPRVFQRLREGGWKLLFQPEAFREREPCPLALLGDGSLLLSLNTSTSPPGTQYGPTRPQVLQFKSVVNAPPEVLVPPFPASATFTDHSYRGLAVDVERGEMLLLHIDSKTSEQHWWLRSSDGSASRTGVVRFPIRACYPQVVLQGSAAHVMAIGDIVEPVEDWQRFKRETTGNAWDYVFRRLFYAWAVDLERGGFAQPIEVDSLEATSGYIRNLDMALDDEGAAHLLYTRRTVQSQAMRDRFFPSVKLTTALMHVVVHRGRVVERAVLFEGGEGLDGPVPGDARFHARPNGELWLVAGLTRAAKSGGRYEITAQRLLPGRGPEHVLPLREPFSALFTAGARGGTAPSDTIDIFGSAGDARALRYARVRIREE